MENVDKLQSGLKVILSIDSVIGAGKTTLLNKYAKMYPDMTFIQEPVDKWVESGLLEKFYANPKEWAFKLQEFIMGTFTDQLQEAFDKNVNYIIMERGPLACFSVFSYLHHKAGILSDEEYNAMGEKHYQYERWLREQGYVLDHIYLNTPLTIAMERLAYRNRINEKSGVSVEYQQRLLDRYKELCITPYTEEQIDSLVLRVSKLINK